jgi:hypothetical protein
MKKTVLLGLSILLVLGLLARAVYFAATFVGLVSLPAFQVGVLCQRYRTCRVGASERGNQDGEIDPERKAFVRLDETLFARIQAGHIRL